MAGNNLPPPHAGFLTVADEQVLRQMIADWRHGRDNPPLRNDEEHSHHQAPETYIAMPVDGIPALQHTGTGTGTGVFSGDVPGKAVCDVYRISGADDSLQLLAIHQTVYNLSETEVRPGWVVISRDKLGKWLAIVGDNGLRPYIITQTETGTGTGTGTGAGSTDVAVYKTSHPSGFNVKLASLSGSWLPAGPDLTMYGDAMGGVVYTGGLVFGSRTNGRLEFVSGPSRHVFRDCRIVGVGSGTTGAVALRADGTVVVSYELPDWMAEIFTAGDPCTVGYEDGKFWIIQRGCGS